jgi:predicted CXXCH cytochrome family protein
VKRMNKGLARRARVQDVVAYPAVSVALVVAMALALSSFGPTPVVALAASTAPVATPTASPTPTSAPSPVATTTPSPVPTTTPSPTVGPVPAQLPSLTLVPGTSPSPVPALPVVPGAALTPIPSLTLTPAAAPGDHHVLARIVGPQFAATYLPVDSPVPDASQFQTFRVRFQMNNAAAVPLTAIPQLEYRPVGGSSYAVVPEQPQVGIPLSVTREWVPNRGGGTKQGPIGADIAVADLLLGAQAGLAVSGHHSMGVNPDQPITLPAGSYTEEEFTVQLTIDAQYLTGYELRITDKVAALTGTGVATIDLGPAPALRLSPGQRQGVSEPGPKATSATAVAYPLRATPLIVADTASAAAVSAVPAVYRPNALNFPLAASALSAATTPTSDIHGPYPMNTSACAICHSVHAAQAPSLVITASQSTVCFTCHDGMGASTDVQTQYKTVTPNQPAAGQYYSHDAVVPSTDTISSVNEFESVSNRSSQCSNCHNAHKASTTDSTEKKDSAGAAIGWTAPGQLAGVSGVSVVNGAANSAPSYTYLDGVAQPVTLEYQLCFKCHSGFTKLLPSNPAAPSTDALDKGAEFNPANASFHPIEAAGTNQSTKMNDSLAGLGTTGSSPYKLWNFTTTSTIRCLNCHANGTTPDATAAVSPGVDLSAHTSNNRGILLRPYQDRILKPAGEPYSAENFALCYVCHAEAPFDNSTSPNNTIATNFPLHGEHLSGAAMMSAGDATKGTNIDTAGAGQGLAICAECHFRSHSTTFKVTPQTVGGSRLVNFAPDVLPYPAIGGTISWTPNTTGGGSCTLTCHGKEHNNLSYN